MRDVEAQAGDRLHFAHQPIRLSSPNKQKYLHKTREEENVVSVTERVGGMHTYQQWAGKSPTQDHSQERTSQTPVCNHPPRHTAHPKSIYLSAWHYRQYDDEVLPARGRQRRGSHARIRPIDDSARHIHRRPWKGKPRAQHSTGHPARGQILGYGLRLTWHDGVASNPTTLRGPSTGTHLQATAEHRVPNTCKRRR